MAMRNLLNAVSVSLSHSPRAARRLDGLDPSLNLTSAIQYYKEPVAYHERCKVFADTSRGSPVAIKTFRFYGHIGHPERQEYFEKKVAQEFTV